MKTVYAKFNSERVPKFQTVTKILQDGKGLKHVVKEALCDQANRHIDMIASNYSLLKSHYHIDLVEPKKEGNQLIFPMAGGVSLERAMIEAVAAGDESKFEHYINLFIEYIDHFVSKREAVFKPCEIFLSIFGEWTDDDPQDLIQIANVDLIFGNIFIDGNDKFTLIDYEWVFDFEIPKNYIIWRAFYQFGSYHLGTPAVAGFKKILDGKINNKSFLETEAQFYSYVYGKRALFALPAKVLKNTNFIDVDSSRRIDPNRLSIQLLIKRANIFSEKDTHSFFIDHVGNTQRFVFPLFDQTSIQALRIDPLNDSCVIKLTKLSLILNDGTEWNLIPFMYTNALSESNGALFFDTNDSQISFNGLSSDCFQKSKSMIVEIQYLSHGKEALNACLQRYKEDQNKLVAQLCAKKVDYKIVFFGASGALERKFEILKALNIIPDYICDNADTKHGTYMFSYEIYSPDRLLNEDKHFLVFITSSYVNEIRLQLKQYKNVTVIGDILNISEMGR